MLLLFKIKWKLCVEKEIFTTHMMISFPGGSEGKEYACNAGYPDSMPEWGRSLGKGNDNPLQDSCLENPVDRGAWRATVHEVEN